MEKFNKFEKSEPQKSTTEIGKSPQILVEKQENISGSTAGAGSGEFHHYRIQRRRERARIYHIEKEAKLKQIQEDFEKMKSKRQNETDEKTKKKAEKRIKKKISSKGKKIRKQQELVGKSLNKFASDGSFLEKFMQQQQKVVLEEKNDNINNNAVDS